MEQVPTSLFTREQKIGFIFMLVFAILTVGLGGLQLRNTIYGPFVIKKTANPLTSVTTNDEARLKNIDTDHDGLNDYDELNQYETSPYLPDTDSDGASDKAEIDKGTDPLCPEGKSCAGSDAAPVVVTSSIASPLVNSQLTPNDILGVTNQLSGQNTAGGQIDLEQLINNPAELRVMLLSTGKIDAATLEKIDDATLQKMARELFVNPGNTAAVNSTSTGL